MEKEYYKKFEKMTNYEIEKKLKKALNDIELIENKIKELQKQRENNYKFINNAKEYLR